VSKHHTEKTEAERTEVRNYKPVITHTHTIISNRSLSYGCLCVLRVPPISYYRIWSP